MLVLIAHGLWLPAGLELGRRPFHVCATIFFVLFIGPNIYIEPLLTHSETIRPRNLSIESMHSARHLCQAGCIDTKAQLCNWLESYTVIAMLKYTLKCDTM